MGFSWPGYQELQAASPFLPTERRVTAEFGYCWCSLLWVREELWPWEQENFWLSLGEVNTGGEWTAPQWVDGSPEKSFAAWKKICFFWMDFSALYLTSSFQVSASDLFTRPLWTACPVHQSCFVKHRRLRAIWWVNSRSVMLGARSFFF